MLLNKECTGKRFAQKYVGVDVDGLPSVVQLCQIIYFELVTNFRKKVIYLEI